MKSLRLLAGLTALAALVAGCSWFRQEPPIVYGIPWESGRLVRGSGGGEPVGDFGRARGTVSGSPVAISQTLDLERDGGTAMAGLIAGWDPATYSLAVHMAAWKQGADAKRQRVSASYLSAGPGRLAGRKGFSWLRGRS